ncbi:LysR family transcriptional regulator [Bordetella genomosp. 13]|uniref:LysR family transcriptional regulator n=1 Tax=Bordetella genomosp. 13 TaxID=463040 RepID=A0A1W6ZE13_9BORD|nr:LysR family transcriptional regulator [Bordetella genomosp. 13]ARP95390.1 LysR family transcriptional regulator [Bordetella genomosp. 13]
MIDLRHIETFFWVASLGSFRAASEKLNTTQPAISQRIASLESDLGVRLFERDARGVTLTGKGHELLSHAERMLQVRRDMMQAAREQNVMSGTLRMGVAETIVQTWLPALIEHVHAAYPALVLQIEVDTTHVLRGQLLARQIDLAFLMGPVREARVENVPLCTYPLAWVASPRLDLGPEPLTLARVGQLPVITYPSSSSPYRAVQDMLVRAGVAPRMYGSASLSMVVRMTLDCIGTSVIAPVFLGKELASGELRLLSVQADPLPDLAFTATWVEGPDSHAARAIARLAQRAAADHERQRDAAQGGESASRQAS